MTPDELSAFAATMVFLLLGAVAVLLPWIAVPSGTGHRILRSLMTVVSPVVIFGLWVWAWLDASLATDNGRSVGCGSNMLFMLHTWVERVEGIPHECVINSRIGVGLLLCGAVGTVVLEYLVLRRLARSRRQAQGAVPARL
ncbi:hypothetical protein [Actinomyces slackii]|uniref:hypothetical protein n=1 Tax=Actinomyces slackii TaxID=52774 RepID=UPI00047A33E1|nr:hypothetical protein [Actinomyces slackii]